MADQNITALPKKTSSQMAATDYLMGIDSAEGYQMLIQDLGDYIIQHATSSLAGANQTLAAAVNALNSNIDYVSSGTIIDYVKQNLVNGKRHGSFLATTVTDKPGTSAGYVVNYTAYLGTSVVYLTAVGASENYQWLGNFSTPGSTSITWEKQPARSEVDALSANMPTPSSIQAISKVAGTPLNLLGNQCYITYGRFFLFHMCIEASDSIPAGTALFQLPSGTYTGFGNNAVFTAAGGVKTFDVLSDGQVVNGLVLSNGDRICTELFGFVS